MSAQHIRDVTGLAHVEPMIVIVPFTGPVFFPSSHPRFLPVRLVRRHRSIVRARPRASPARAVLPSPSLLPLDLLLLPGRLPPIRHLAYAHARVYRCSPNVRIVPCLFFRRARGFSPPPDDFVLVFTRSGCRRGFSQSPCDFHPAFTRFGHRRGRSPDDFDLAFACSGHRHGRSPDDGVSAVTSSSRRRGFLRPSDDFLRVLTSSIRRRRFWHLLIVDVPDFAYSRHRRGISPRYGVIVLAFR